MQASSISLCSSSSLPSILSAASKTATQRLSDRSSLATNGALSISTAAEAVNSENQQIAVSAPLSVLTPSPISKRPPTPPISPMIPPPPSQPLPSPPIASSTSQYLSDELNSIEESGKQAKPRSRKHLRSLPILAGGRSNISDRIRIQRLSLNTKLTANISDYDEESLNSSEVRPVSPSSIKFNANSGTTVSRDQDDSEADSELEVTKANANVSDTEQTPENIEEKRMKELPSSNASIFALNEATVSIAGTETRVEMGAPVIPSSISAKSSSFFKRVGLFPNGTENIQTSANGDSDQAVFSVRKGKRLFTVYKILIKSSSAQQWAVYKRYSEFDALDRELQKHFPLLHKNLPELPPKRFFWDNMSSEFIQNRAAGLHKYMQQIFFSPVLLRSKPVREFLIGGTNGNISSITAPLSLVDKMDDSDDISSNTDSEEQYVSPRMKPDAVFSTTETPSGTMTRPLKKSAFKKSGFSKTLKRVGWGRTIFENKQQPDVVFTQAIPAYNTQSTVSTMFYPQRSAANNNIGSLSSTSSSEIGARVNIDDFNLLKIIGKGNFGKVMLAQHKELQQVFAIKVISKNAIKKKSAKHGNKPSREIDHIMAERNVLVRSVHHPFLIGLRWAFQTTEKLYFVTDYVNGGELFFHLQKERKFSELRARFYAAEIVSALEYLHVEVDVVYRDLKPENILLDSEGHIKLTDFGLAKEHFHRQNRGRTSTFCGTPEYLAPEVLRKEPYGFPVDWWCLGSVLFEMLVGLPPFYSKDVQEMYDKILNEKLKFPSQITLRSRSIISGLLHRSPYFRLGTGPNNTSNPSSVKSHPFFEGLDWQRLYKREYTPPFVPTVSHLYDLRNIDPQFVNEPIPASIIEDGILNCPGGDSEMTQGFEIEVSGISATQPNGNPLTFKGFTFVGDDDWLQSDD